MQNLLFSPRVRLALILPTLVALAITIPLFWILIDSLLRQAATTQLLNAVPIVSGLIRDDLDQDPANLQVLVTELVAQNPIRLTVVDDSGQVLADSGSRWSEVREMDNHADRPEIAAALVDGQGSSVRRSATTGLTYVYAAETIRDSGGRLVIVRLAQPVFSLAVLREKLAWIILASTLSALLGLSTWIWWLRRRIARVAPELLESARHLEDGDFSYRVRISAQTELGRLGRFLNNVAAQAENQITDLKTQRQQLVTVVSSMQEGVLVTDAEGFIRLANPALYRLFGLSDPCEGLTPLECTRQSRLEDLIIATLTTGEPQWAEIELEGPTPPRIAVATTSLGEGEGAIIVARDVTDLIRLGQIRRDFVANVSHELKTPLTAIRGYAETLRYGDIDDAETATRFLDQILQQCARLQALLEDLLTLSRLESLEDRGERTAVQLDDLLQECLGSITPQAEEKRIRLEIDSRSLPSIQGDRDGLERVLINLLDNAVKYNRVGGSVKASLAEGEDEVIFEVADTGIGVPAGSLQRVFERFYRVDKGRSRKEGGTGLGLAIVKHVTQVHGGRVEVESRLGKGSIFRVRLPTHPSQPPVPRPDR